MQGFGRGSLSFLSIDAVRKLTASYMGWKRQESV